MLELNLNYENNPSLYDYNCNQKRIKLLKEYNSLLPANEKIQINLFLKKMDLGEVSQSCNISDYELKLFKKLDSKDILSYMDKINLDEFTLIDFINDMIVGSGYFSKIDTCRISEHKIFFILIKYFFEQCGLKNNLNPILNISDEINTLIDENFKIYENIIDNCLFDILSNTEFSENIYSFRTIISDNAEVIRFKITSKIIESLVTGNQCLISNKNFYINMNHIFEAGKITLKNLDRFLALTSIINDDITLFGYYEIIRDYNKLYGNDIIKIDEIRNMMADFLEYNEFCKFSILSNPIFVVDILFRELDDTLDNSFPVAFTFINFRNHHYLTEFDKNLIETRNFLSLIEEYHDEKDFFDRKLKMKEFYHYLDCIAMNKEKWTKIFERILGHIEVNNGDYTFAFFDESKNMIVQYNAEKFILSLAKYLTFYFKDSKELINSACKRVLISKKFS